MQPSITLSKSVRIVIAALIPLLAAIVQNWLWRTIPVSAWMLLYPALVFSVWIGGPAGGIIGTLTATLLGVYYFIPPTGSWLVEDRHGFSVLLFAAMGVLLSLGYGIRTRKQLWRQEHDSRMLRAQHERLRLALAASQAGWWEWDIKTGHMFWSDDLANLYGLEPRTPPSYEHWLSSVHPDDQESAVAQLQQFVQQRQAFNLEWRVNQPGATPQRWLMSRGQPVFTANGQLGFYRGIVLDITERKQTEAEKHYAETRYQTLVDQAIPDGVYLHDHDGVILDVNQVACAKAGYRRSELLGKNVMDIEKLENFDLAQAQTLWAGIEPGTVKNFIGLHQRKDGKPISGGSADLFVAERRHAPLHRLRPRHHRATANRTNATAVRATLSALVRSQSLAAVDLRPGNPGLPRCQ